MPSNTSIVAAAMIALFNPPVSWSAVDSGESEAAHAYNEAEQWFHEWEANNHATPLEPVTLIRDGFFQRCYQPDVAKVCFGVAVGTIDGFLWKQINDGQWVIEMPMPAMSDQLAVVLGKLRGKLGNDLLEYLDKATGSATKEAKTVVLGEGALTNANSATIRQAYKANQAIILLNATASEVARLQRMIKLTGYYRLPDSDRVLDAFAVRMDEKGDVKTIKVMRPQKLPDSISKEGASSTPLIEAQIAEDSDALQAIRTGKLMELLREASQAVPSLPADPMAETMPNGNEFAPLEATVRSVEGHMVFQFRKNTHTLTTNVWSIHQSVNDEDWFYVRQKGSFSAAGEILDDAKTLGGYHRRGYFTDMYSVRTGVNGYDISSPSVWLSDTSPKTTSETERVTSSTEWNLGGEVSGTGKCETGGKCEVGGGVKVSGGVKSGYSRTFDIPDMSLVNESSGNQAAWSFDIAQPYYKLWSWPWQDGGIFELKKLSYGTFEPTLQWYWKVNREVRDRRREGLPVYVHFKTRVRYMAAGGMMNKEYPSGVLTETMLVPWPTIVK